MKIIASVDGAHYMDKPIIQALRKLYGPQRAVKVVRKANPNASLVLFSLWGHESPKMPKAKKIMLCGEPISTANANYNIIVDCKQTPGRRRKGARFIYFPFYAWSFSERFQNHPQDLVRKASPEQILKTKTKFCAFM